MRSCVLTSHACVYSKQGKKLHYKGTHFHRIIGGFMCQGGGVWSDSGGAPWQSSAEALVTCALSGHAVVISFAHSTHSITRRYHAWQRRGRRVYLRCESDAAPPVPPLVLACVLP